MLCVFSVSASEPPIKILQDMDYNPYDYSDAKPRIRSVFSADISQFGEWKSDDGYNRMDECWKTLEAILEKINFKGLSVRHQSGRLGNTDNDFIFGRLDSQQRLIDCLFVHLEYSTRSRSLHLSPSECDTYDYKPAVHMALSWRYTNTAYRSIFETIQCYGTDNEIIAERVPGRVNRKGLEQSFLRIGIVINDDYTVSFYNAFETPEQQEKG